MIRLIPLVAILAGALHASDAPVESVDAGIAAAPTSSAIEAPESEVRNLQQFGATYVLVRNTRSDSVETEEYVLEGETLDNWSQLLTYQRIRTVEPFGADQYVALLKRHLGEVRHAPRFRIVQQGPRVSIFGVHYPRTETHAEQFGLAFLSVPDSQRPNELHLIQLVADPAQFESDELKHLVQRWQARLQSQAASLGLEE